MKLLEDITFSSPKIIQRIRYCFHKTQFLRFYERTHVQMQGEKNENSFLNSQLCNIQNTKDLQNPQKDLMLNIDVS